MGEAQQLLRGILKSTVVSVGELLYESLLTCLSGLRGFGQSYISASNQSKKWPCFEDCDQTRRQIASLGIGILKEVSIQSLSRACRVETPPSEASSRLTRTALVTHATLATTAQEQTQEELKGADDEW